MNITKYFLTAQINSWKRTQKIDFANLDISDLPITSFKFQRLLVLGNDISENLK